MDRVQFEAEFDRIREAARPFFNDFNVQSISIGEKSVSNEATSQLALVIGVERKADPAAVPPGYLIPSVLEIPASNGKPAFEIVTDVVPEQRFSFSLMRAPLNAATFGFAGAPIQAQQSVSGPGRNGAVVEDQSGQRHLLSCNHVLTDFGRQSIAGNPILDARDNQEVANLGGVVPLFLNADNLTDVSLAPVNDPQTDNDGSIAGIRSTPLSKDDVVHTHSSVGGSGVVNTARKDVTVFGWGGNNSLSCRFLDQIEVVGIGSLGESGTAVLDNDGLLAGIYIADDNGLGIVTPIGTILGELARNISINNQPIQISIA